MSVNNLQQTIHSCQETIYTLFMPFYDAEKFAARLREIFDRSRFKSHAQLADEAKLTRSAVSSLMSAKPQTATNKPSQPRAETVIRLSTALGADPNELLLLAGHAPLSETRKRAHTLPELLEALDDLGIKVNWATVKNNFENYTPDDFEELKEQIAANAGVKIKRILNR